MTNEDLVWSYQEGNKEAMEKLLKQNRRLVWSVVRKFNPRLQEDLMQEGMIGLIKAAERFQFDKGAQFSTYSLYWIRQQVYRAAKPEPEIVSLDKPLAEDDDLTLMDIVPIDQPTTEEQLEKKAGEEVVNSYLEECLVPNQLEVVKHKYGFYGCREKTLSEISELLSLPVDEVKSLLGKAIRVLRNPKKIWELRKKLDRETDFYFRSFDPVLDTVIWREERLEKFGVIS